VNTQEAETEMAQISLSGYSHASQVAEVPARQAAAAVARAKAATAANRSAVTAEHSSTQSTNQAKRSAQAGTRNTRRALPARVVE
jgi:hypothetical protein